VRRGVVPGERARQHREALVQDVAADIRRGPRDRAVDRAPPIAPLEIVLQRDPERGLVGKAEPIRSDAHDPMVDLVDRKGRTDGGGVPTEPSRPESVRDDDDGGRSRLGVGAGDVPPERWPHVEELHESAGHPGHWHALGRSAHV